MILKVSRFGKAFLRNGTNFLLISIAHSSQVHFFGTKKTSVFPLEVVKPNTWYKYANQNDPAGIHGNQKKEKNKESKKKKKKWKHEHPKGKEKKKEKKEEEGSKHVLIMFSCSHECPEVATPFVF